MLVDDQAEFVLEGFIPVCFQRLFNIGYRTLRVACDLDDLPR